jgi:hypothetical protein
MSLKFSQAFHLMPTPSSSFVVTNGTISPHCCHHLTYLLFASHLPVANYTFADMFRLNLG